MKLFLNTSTPVTELILLDNNEKRHHVQWESGRSLSRDLLSFLQDNLAKLNEDFSTLDGLGVYQGPGSFTGLRIGITVSNTLADSLGIPIVGVTGKDWLNEAIEKLNDGQNDKIVLPFYGAEANITTPRK